MSPATMNTLYAPGFYGKLPIRGDFVSRRLRRDFLDPWDHWLQTAMASSRELLAENWLPGYLTSPLWRFALSPGVCGEQAYAGVLMPSVDRVGRYYPLTIAIALEADRNPLPLAQDWFRETERVALSSLDEGLELEAFDKDVLALGPPALTVTGGDFPDSLALYRPLADLAVLGKIGVELADSQHLPYVLHRTLWWSKGSRCIEPCLLVCEGLPPTAGFAAMLAGDWRRWGWSEPSTIIAADVTPTKEPI